MTIVSSDTHRAASALAKEGHQVLACHGIASGGCTCRRPGCSSPGKHPLLRQGLHDATTDPSTIERWWTRWPNANLGIRTGAASELIVLDVDLPDGLDSLDRLNRIGRGLPPTATVRTGSGGLHLYFRHPGITIPNRASSVLGPGIDVRGDGGYVIAPPSTHVSGQTYEWDSRIREPHLPPTWLTAILAADVERRTQPPALDKIRADRGVSAWARSALEGELRRITAARDGRRNHTLNRSAFVLGQIVGGGHLDREHVESLLLSAGQSAGLGDRETRRTVESGLSAGERSPRHPPDRAQASVDLRRVELPSPKPVERVAPAAGIEL